MLIKKKKKKKKISLTANDQQHALISNTSIYDINKKHPHTSK